MRLLLIVALVMCAGCPVDGEACNVDNDCEPTEVCARDHSCVAPDQVYATRTTWTVNGQPADNLTCGVFTNQFQILFKLDLNDSSDDKLGFAPVPCNTGLFNVDKLPVRYRAVKLLDEVENTTLAGTTFDADGLATIDLVTP